MVQNGDDSGGQSFTGDAPLTASSTLSSIRSACQAAFIANFNFITGRTDGNQIQFVWLDDRGLL